LWLWRRTSVSTHSGARGSDSTTSTNALIEYRSSSFVGSFSSSLCSSPPCARLRRRSRSSSWRTTSLRQTHTEPRGGMSLIASAGPALRLSLIPGEKRRRVLLRAWLSRAGMMRWSMTKACRHSICSAAAPSVALHNAIRRAYVDCSSWSTGHAQIDSASSSNASRYHSASSTFAFASSMNLCVDVRCVLLRHRPRRSRPSCRSASHFLRHSASAQGGGQFASNKGKTRNCRGAGRTPRQASRRTRSSCSPTAHKNSRAPPWRWWTCTAPPPW